MSSGESCESEREWVREWKSGRVRVRKPLRTAKEPALVWKKCLNVRQKLGTRSLSLALSPARQKTTFLGVVSRRLSVLSSNIIESLKSLKLSISQINQSVEKLEKLKSKSLTLTLSHSLTLDMLNNFCFHVYAQKSLSHSHTLSFSHSLTLSMSHSHTLTLSLSHSLTLHMLNNFCFHVYAQKSPSHFLTLILSH